MVPFLFIGVLVVGGILRAVLGRTLGSLATGGLAGGVIWVLSKVIGFAIAGGVIATLFALFAGIARNVGNGRRGGGGGFAGGSGGSWSSGSSGGGFSGGGGSFGGGGASGRW
jgi:uncharacterized protein